MNFQDDLGLFAETADVTIERTRRTGILPEVHESQNFTEAEWDALRGAWMEGMQTHADRAAKAEREAFAARGWPFRWLTQTDDKMADALLEAVEVFDQYHRPIWETTPTGEDMGLLMCEGRKKSEGVRVKWGAYAENTVLISIGGVVGPTNFDPSDGSLEFEPGAKSFLFHLYYEMKDSLKLPEAERVAGDLAALPLLKAVSDSNKRWRGEGWTGPDKTRPRLLRSWTEFDGPPNQPEPDLPGLDPSVEPSGI